MASPYFGASQAQLDKTYHRTAFGRTPSPTPSEQAVLDDDGKPHLEKYFKKENWSEHSTRSWQGGVRLTTFRIPPHRGYCSGRRHRLCCAA
jgi:hypothetical protein